MTERNPFRLPTNVIPHSCELDIAPDLATHTFEGKVRHFIKITEPIQEITLNSLDLSIGKVSYTPFPLGKMAEVHQITHDDAHQMISLRFADMLEPGQGHLEIHYHGPIREDLEGFYQTKTVVGDETYFGGATQFEATAARKAFPCWDEPAFKTSVRLTLTVPNDLKAISNMALQYTETVCDKHIVSFHWTPPLPTYLIAWFVGKFDQTETREVVCTLGKESRTVPITLYTPPGKAAQGAFALDFAAKLLPAFVHYHGIFYPFEKLDLIAAADFGAGAMENPGAISFRETALLIDSLHSSLAALERVADVVAHEMAHMWFGDSVTMEWWNDLGGNEGWASWFGPLGVNMIFPGWNEWDKFFARSTLSAFYDDARMSTYPVRVDVENPAEIGAIFAGIVYAKYASVIRMLQEHLGDPKMQKTMELFFQRYRFRNATARDLWDTFKEALGESVSEIMVPYTETPGYPLISVERVKDQPHMLRLTQQRFVADSDADAGSQMWHVPLTIMAENGKSEKILLDARTNDFTLQDGAEGWTKVNYGATSYCRVRYEKEMLREFVPAVRSIVLPVRDRIELLDTIFALSRAGQAKTSEALEFLTAYRGENNYYVWETIANWLERLDDLLDGQDSHARFDVFARDFYLPHAKHLGWTKGENEHYLVTRLRSLALHGAGQHGDQDIIDRVKTEFAHHLVTGSLDPNLRTLVYKLAAKHGGIEAYRDLRSLHEKSDLQEEKRRLTDAMGHIRDSKIIDEHLDFLLSGEVRKGDISFALIATATHAIGRKKYWEFVKQNWERLVRDLNTHRLLGYALMGLRGVADPDMFGDAHRFLTQHPVESIVQITKELLEDIKIDVAWLTRDRDDIREWLEAHAMAATEPPV